MPITSWSCILLSGIALLGCGRPQGLQVGGVTISADSIQSAVDDLRITFSTTGEASARWLLLDGGMGPAAILHHRLKAESDAVLQEAQKAADRIRAGATFSEVALSLGQNTQLRMLQPAPFAIGAIVAAKVASLEEGEWAGPLASLDGWELFRLEQRGGSTRSRAGVALHRIRFPVGEAKDRELAEELWNSLPLSGSPEWLATLPTEFRRGRIAPKSSP
jgi:hypothetical protein